MADAASLNLTRMREVALDRDESWQIRAVAAAISVSDEIAPQATNNILLSCRRVSEKLKLLSMAASYMKAGERPAATLLRGESK